MIMDAYKYFTHEDDWELIGWAVENGWRFVMSPQGITLITKPGIPLAFAVEPRLTDNGRIIISKQREAAA